jgi:hypothetical protein
MVLAAGTAIESFAKLADSIYFYRSAHSLTDPQAGVGDYTIDGEQRLRYTMFARVNSRFYCLCTFLNNRVVGGRACKTVL